jgi:hypothetical protein
MPPWFRAHSTNRASSAVKSIGVDVANHRFAVGGSVYPEGTAISIDGESGAIYLADIPLRPASTGRAELVELVRASAAISGAHVAVAALDSPTSAARARREPMPSSLA